MHPNLKAHAALSKGILAYRDVDRVTLDNAVRAGHLIRVFPRTYVDSERFRRAGRQEQHLMRVRAALRYLNGKGFVSHRTALGLWQLRELSGAEPIDVSVDRGVRHRSQPGLLIHRRRQFAVIPRNWRFGLEIATPPWAILDSWPLLPDAQRRAVVIDAVRSRLVTPAKLKQAVRKAPNLGGVRDLRSLLQLLDDGCRSQLEIWGALHVFTGPGMPAFKRQFRVTVGGQTFYLDVYAEQQRVGFELDGAAWHGSQEQRERDIRRDALLARIGIQVVRFSYRRLTSQPETVRREILAILAVRGGSGQP